MVGILGKKLGMTQLFQPDGTWLPVTVVEAGPCRVMQVKVTDTAELSEPERSATTNFGKKRGKVDRPRRADGYYAVQLGFDDRREKSASKPELGHAARAGAPPKSFVRELRYAAMPPFKRGDEIRVDVLKDIKRVDVTGTTKGRGFAGTIKRYGFQRQAMSHGNSKHHRKPGGLGRTYSINKGVPKNKRMCGHYGVELRTVQNLEVVKIDAERNLVFLHGAVPGHRSSYLVMRESVKK
jgi:large subunit ribosomal protein L3